MKRVLITLVVALAAVALAACSSGAGGSSSEGSSSSADPAASSSSAAAVATDAESVVTIPLDYNAGTGYEWQCSVEPEGVVAQVGQATEDLAEGGNIDGGPLQDKFTFRAQGPGEAVITFALVRGWEGEPAETQVYAFTVSDDLKMILNPYKSDFVNEPEWGGNA